MKAIHIWRVALALLLLSFCGGTSAASTVHGFVFDPNWYAPSPQATGCYGMGLYEYGIGGNASGDSGLGFYDDTNSYGSFYKNNQADGVYTLASWDVWFRSAYVFDHRFQGWLPPMAVIKQHANMWTYPMTTGPFAHEWGQTFKASGKSVVLVHFLSANVSNAKWKVSIHQEGPNGAQIGPSRTLNAGGELRVKWSGNEVPTIPGNIYYLKLRAFDKSTGAATTCALSMQYTIPDLCDPMPDGCAWRDGVPYDGAGDLAVTICSDDDGLLTGPYIHKSATWPGVTSAGQTFVARGTSLISFCAWSMNTSDSLYAKLYDGVNGNRIGPAKISRVMRGADPEVIWTWSPGECELIPGHTYYIEVTRVDSQSFTIFASQWNEYTQGVGYANRVSKDPWDLCCTVMQEEAPGSAVQAAVRFTEFPAVAFADRDTNSITVRWTTDVPADSRIEYSAWNCPYTGSFYDSTLTTEHVATLEGLQPNAMYHYRVSSCASGLNPGITRDLIACTINDSPNLLTNPGFEEGSLIGDNPNARSLDGWNYYGAELKANNGFGPPWRIEPDPENNIEGERTEPSTYLNETPYAGDWHCEGAINGQNYNGLLWQRVPATPGAVYRFTTAISSWMMESGVWKYDKWNDANRLDYLKIGIDPTGGTNPNGFSVKWTPQFYSHLSYNTVGVEATATGSYVTAFISLKGIGGYLDFWHIYAVDDCRLSRVVDYEDRQLAELKTGLPDGTNIRVGGLVITATSSEAGAYYAEEPDRAQGIRIESSCSAASGQQVTVTGTLLTRATGEKYIADAIIANASAATEPEPLMMTAESVGCSASGNAGPDNTGILIKIAGKVISTDPSGAFMIVDDGSTASGLRVDTSRLPLSSLPQPGEVIGVIGVSSLYETDDPQPIVIARRTTDIGAPFDQ